MPRVQVVHWNPRVRLGSRGLVRRLPGLRRLNNFGDLLGPAIVARILAERGIDDRAAVADRRLLTVGSIMKLAKTGDVVWGTGVNGKSIGDAHAYTSLDVRAVRGPLTREFLKNRGIDAPEVYGDPGLLVSRLWPEVDVREDRRSTRVTIVPNFHDYEQVAGDARVLNPRSPLSHCIRTIAGSDLVVGTSLHGIVLAESYGIPARLVRSLSEPDFKYRDYYLGTGREHVEVAASEAEAIEMGGERPPVFDADLLMTAFPVDLWRTGRLDAGDAPW